MQFIKNIGSSNKAQRLRKILTAPIWAAACPNFHMGSRIAHNYSALPRWRRQWFRSICWYLATKRLNTTSKTFFTVFCPRTLYLIYFHGRHLRGSITRDSAFDAGPLTRLRAIRTRNSSFFGRGERTFSSQHCPDRPSGPNILFFHGKSGGLLHRYSDWDMKLTTLLHLDPSWRRRVAYVLCNVQRKIISLQ